VLLENPLTICDCGHNIDGIKQIIQLIEHTQHDQLHIVWGMVSDKDPNVVLSMLPKGATYYFCAPDIPRALDVVTLANHAKDLGLIGTCFSTVSAALEAAVKSSLAADLVFVGGSTFVVAEAV